LSIDRVGGRNSDVSCLPKAMATRDAEWLVVEYAAESECRISSGGVEPILNHYEHLPKLQVKLNALGECLRRPCPAGDYHAKLEFFRCARSAFRDLYYAVGVEGGWRR